ncbi:fatty acid desaturase [Thalassococcus sp. S3]|uniref:fatty acid desaturase n=1 Tax=Thalassococcus sp. S3 TaxID=2017482 RepID=UPI0010248712|nr:fatty acid desaturase [Thalassococcus sp. S3]QBF31595.1 fatty acid desaturase [Thalassococcus sp. S3]
MDHRAALAAIPPDRKSILHARSDIRGLVHLAGHLGAIALTGTAIATGIPGWPLLLVPHGVLLVFLFTLTHECTHKTPFRTGWLNEGIGHLTGTLIFLPFTWFRYFHLAHHKYTNDPLRDPELTGGERPETWPALLLYLSGWDYWRGAAATFWTMAFGTISAPYLPQRKHSAMRRDARWMLAAYLLAALSLPITPILFWLWLLPLLIGQPVLRIYLLAEHGRCPPVANMLENSRTTFTNRIVRTLAWNMPYHAEHHAAPNVPFHRLPDLHADLAPHLKSTAPGYAAFARDYAGRMSAADN